jgi:hypothetical protein
LGLTLNQFLAEFSFLSTKRSSFGLIHSNREIWYEVQIATPRLASKAPVGLSARLMGDLIVPPDLRQILVRLPAGP